MLASGRVLGIHGPENQINGMQELAQMRQSGSRIALHGKDEVIHAHVSVADRLGERPQGGWWWVLGTQWEHLRCRGGS